MPTFGIGYVEYDTLPMTMYVWLVSGPINSSVWCLTSRMLAMNKDHADCAPLLVSTTSALGEETLQMLLISTQRTNIELCINYAVGRSFAGILTLSFT